MTGGTAAEGAAHSTNSCIDARGSGHDAGLFRRLPVRQSALRSENGPRRGPCLQLLAMWPAGLIAGVRAGKSIQAPVWWHRPDEVRIQQAHDRAPVLLNLRHPVICNRDTSED